MKRAQQAISAARVAGIYGSRRCSAALVFPFLLMFCAAAAAQQYKWVDQDGRVQYGDSPPPGAKATRLRGASGPSSPSPAPDAKSARKGPLTPAEQEAEFQKRRKAEQDAAAKSAKERDAADLAKQNCENAQQQLATLESGQRLARVDAKGERQFMEDAQRESETARARQAVSKWCK